MREYVYFLCWTQNQLPFYKNRSNKEVLPNDSLGFSKFFQGEKNGYFCRFIWTKTVSEACKR